MSILTIASDLHIEMSPDVPEMGQGDILALCGDILTVAHLQSHRTDKDGRKLREKFVSFLENLKYDLIFWVPGNHEYYGMPFGYETDVILRKELEKLSIGKRIKVMNNNFFEMEKTVFIGSTLWSDSGFSIGKEVYIQNFMNDFERIKWNKRKLTPQKVYETFKDSEEFLRKTLSTFQNRQMVVLTHHAPLFTVGRGVTDDYAYCSDQSRLMLDYNPKLWAYGHTHEIQDFYVGNTRVVSNPRGYVGIDWDAVSFNVNKFRFNLENL